MNIPVTNAPMSAADFPLPFSSLRRIAGGRDASYIAGSMFTPRYAHKAMRFAASCETFGVPYEIHEVAEVHRSIDSHGTPDPAFTKANFIRHLMTQRGKPVLYVDADCEFVSEPAMLEPLARSVTDFAVYNWLADEHTDAFAPVEISISSGPPIKNRFYAFTHNVDHFATDQLLCSGPAQFYGNSDGARLLLSEWFRTIAAFPGVADDECLDFTFNNLGPRAKSLRTIWLPKAYARHSWWIYAKPVINHPDAPKEENNFIPIEDPAGRLRFYPARTEKRDFVRLFPRNCIIDTAHRMVCRMVGNQLVAISPTDQNFWL
jgi:hypothetical protein